MLAIAHQEVTRDSNQAHQCPGCERQQIKKGLSKWRMNLTPPIRPVEMRFLINDDPLYPLIFSNFSANLALQS